MVADEEGAAGVRRGGLSTSDDFLTCEGLSGGGVAAGGPVREVEDLPGRHLVPLGLAKDCRAKAPPRPGKALLVGDGRQQDWGDACRRRAAAGLGSGTCEAGVSGEGAAAAGEGTAGVRSGGFAVPTFGAFRTCEGLSGGGGGVGGLMILTPRVLLLSS